MNTLSKKILALSFLAAALTACSNPSKPSEKNFTAAMDEYFKVKGDLCLHLRKWPVDIDEQGYNHGPTMQQMKALESVGLVTAESLEKEVSVNFSFTTVKHNFKRFNLTEAAKSFDRSAESNANTRTDAKPASDLCWGKKSTDKIVKWDQPGVYGDASSTSITYTYKVNKLADWAKTPAVQEAFPEIKKTLEAAKNEPQKHYMNLTNVGWEAIDN